MHDELAHRRLKRAARYADLHATPQEHRHIQLLLKARHDGHVTVDDALEALAHLRRTQQLRDAA